MTPDELMQRSIELLNERLELANVRIAGLERDIDALLRRIKNLEERMP